MLTARTVAMVEFLLAVGISYRRVAETLPVSKGTVENIAKGMHCPAHRQPAKPVRPPNLKFIVPAVDWTDPGYARCPKCGGKVRMPCLACDLRKLKK